MTPHTAPLLQVLDFFQSRSTDVLVTGDSMMRQLFIRLAHMMRGTRRVMDYHVHAHASYAVRGLGCAHMQRCC